MVGIRAHCTHSMVATYAPIVLLFILAGVVTLVLGFKIAKLALKLALLLLALGCLGFGVLWEQVSPGAAFFASALMGAMGSTLLFGWRRRR